MSSVERYFVTLLAARWIGLPVRQVQHFLLSTASLSILGYEHNLAEGSAIILWNAVWNEIFDLVTSQVLKFAAMKGAQ